MGGFSQHTDNDDVIIKGSDDVQIGQVGDKIKIDMSANDTLTDAFGRLKVSGRTSLWQYSHTYNEDQDRYWDEGSVGTYVKDTNGPHLTITNTTTNGDNADYRTKRQFEYHKGRNQSYLATVNPKSQETNVTKRWGMFDDRNGVFFQLDGTNGFQVVVRSYVTGSVVDTTISQASFNKDVLDGSGSSGINLDFSDLNLWYIDYSWLGTNLVEFGVIADGHRIAAHRFNFSNSITTAWSQSGNLPVCNNIENNAALGTAPTMQVNCFDISFEGTNDVYGAEFNVNTGATDTTIGTTQEVVAAIRLKSANNRYTGVKPEHFEIFSTSGNSAIFWEIHIGLVVGGSPTWTSINNSICEGLDSSTTNFTAGDVIEAGYLQAGEANFVLDISSDLYAGRLIDGTSQVIALVCRTVTATSKILFSGNFREYK